MLTSIAAHRYDTTYHYIVAQRREPGREATMDTGPSRHRAPRSVATDPLTSPGAYPEGAAEQRREFEERRLAAFRRRGFSGVGRRIPDHAGRETYVLVSEGESACPTVLVH